MIFEKFTERGRKVIVYAREEAERRNNDYLGTEHMPVSYTHLTLPTIYSV